MPVPAGINLPIITFSFKPNNGSILPLIAASVRTRVVSWKDAADKKESVAKASGEGLAGEAGIPVVAGANVHRLLRLKRTRVMELLPGSRDMRGNLLPENLMGALLWGGRDSTSG